MIQLTDYILSDVDAAGLVSPVAAHSRRAWVVGTVVWVLSMEAGGGAEVGLPGIGTII